MAGRIEINHAATISLIMRGGGLNAHTDASCLKVLTLQQTQYLLEFLCRNSSLFARNYHRESRLMIRKKNPQRAVCWPVG